MEPRNSNSSINTAAHSAGNGSQLDKVVSYSDVEKSDTREDVDVVDDYPDGGLRAWLVVFGGSLGLCATFGFVNAWGIFQVYYQEVMLRHMSPSDIAWIGSLQYALVFMPGLAFGRFFDMGHLRLPVFVASALLIACTFLTAECTEFWHFILCQGFGIGIASGAVFTIGAGVITHWFHKRLGLALACLASGSSVGGTIFPIILRNLMEHHSFKWTLRITGFIMMAFLIVMNLTLARRLPPKPHQGPFVNLSLFKDITYSIFCLSLLVGFLGLYTCLTYISLSGVLAGLDADLSFYLLSIANACSLVGRIGGGAMADRVGPTNVLIPGTLAAAVMTYAWPFAHTRSSLIAVAVLYGVSSGVFVAIMAQPVVRMGKVTEVGMRTGMAFTVMSLGAVAGPPISGAILDHTGALKNVGYFAGSTMVGSVLLMAIARHLLLGKFVGKI